jgi:uncharacterized caspase-like protein
MMTQRPLFALLVGINRYASPTVPDLAGCENDVLALRTLLQEHFGVPAEAILVLLNEAAARQAIYDAFRTHLLAPLQRAQLGEQPAVLFYFSGHGSQAPLVNQPGHLGETLVPHDSRTNGVYDIKDHELGLWLTELTKYTSNVTVILDCCHAGSGTRPGEKKLPTHVRGCAADDRPQPGPIGLLPVMRGALAHSGQPEHLNYVSLAACRNDQKAREANFGDPPQRHGLFTYWLLDALRHQSPHQPLTYRTLYDQVYHRLHSVAGVNAQQVQTPQCEGDYDRFFLGDRRAVRSRWLSVLAERDGLLWVNSGQIHGMRAGALLHLYPPTLEGATPVGAPLAMVEVDTVEATQSGCIRLDNPPWTPIPPGARAFVQRYGPTHQRIKVALDFSEGMLLTMIRQRLLQPDIYEEITIALLNESADLRLTLKNGRTFELLSGDREQVYRSYPPGPDGPQRRIWRADDFDPIVRDLRHLVKQAQVGAIMGGLGSEMTAALQVSLRQLLPATSADPFPTAPLTKDENGSLLLPVATPFVLQVENHYDKPLYLTVLEFGYQGDIRRVYPTVAGANEAVAPGGVLTLGRTRDAQTQLQMVLPPAVTSAVERFKLFASIHQADFEHLLQEELPKPLPPAPRPAPPGTPHRTAYPRVSDLEPAEQWGSIDVRVRVVQAVN